jgi:hypothetical protein
MHPNLISFPLVRNNQISPLGKSNIPPDTLFMKNWKVFHNLLPYKILHKGGKYKMCIYLEYNRISTDTQSLLFTHRKCTDSVI